VFLDGQGGVRTVTVQPSDRQALDPAVLEFEAERKTYAMPWGTVVYLQQPPD